jgi:hypothetical protein
MLDEEHDAFHVCVVHREEYLPSSGVCICSTCERLSCTLASCELLAG